MLADSGRHKIVPARVDDTCPDSHRPAIHPVAPGCPQDWIAFVRKCVRNLAGLASLPKHIPIVLEDNEIIAIVNFKYGPRATPRREVADTPIRPASKVRPAPKAAGGGAAGPDAERNTAKRQRKLERDRNDRAKLASLRAVGPHPGPPYHPHPDNAGGGGKGGKGKAKGAKGKA